MFSSRLETSKRNAHAKCHNKPGREIMLHVANCKTVNHMAHTLVLLKLSIQNLGDARAENNIHYSSAFQVSM